MLRVLTDDEAHGELTCGLDEIVREGARRMLVAALEAEVDGYVSAFVDHVDERGHPLVTRNGHAGTRTITTAAGGSRSKRLGSTTAGSTRRPGSVAGSARPSCRRGAARAPRSPRCCR